MFSKQQILSSLLPALESIIPPCTFRSLVPLSPSRSPMPLSTYRSTTPNQDITIKEALELEIKLELLPYTQTHKQDKQS